MSATVAVTTSGRVEGHEEGHSVAFRGIPFAEPPVGSLRYHKPVPPLPWDGVRPCHAFGARSLQGSARRGQPGRPGAQSEDCLYLNVWTPAVDDGARAVIVYVHGGGYVIGSASEEFLTGAVYADDDVVVVSFNHRLGALGFLHVDELFEGMEGTGNLGLHDTIAVLEWVRDNIAAFGGDPDRVSLGGHSAGGITTTALMASPLAAGLFSRAFPISSASGHSWISVEDADAVARRVLSALGIPPGDREALLARPGDDFILPAELFNGLYEVAKGHPFEPVVDGDLLDRSPFEAIKAGASAGVDLLVGHMAEEFRLCVFDDAGEVRDPPLKMGVSADGFDYGRLLRPTGVPAETALDVYRHSLAANGRAVNDPEIFSMVATDVVMLNPGAALAAAHHAHGKGRTWAYRFAWRPPAGEGRVGACHGIDIPYFFNRLDADLWATMYQGGGDPVLADFYRRSMAAMARDGDPNQPGLPSWPEYEPLRRATMVFDSQTTVVDDPEGERRRLFDSAPPYKHPGYIEP